MRRLKALWVKEWRSIVRQDVTFLVLIQPLVFCVLWGYCASLDLDDVPVVVLDASASAEGRAVVRALEATGRFTVARRAASMTAVRTALLRGEASLAVVIPPRLPTALRRGRGDAVAVLADGSDPIVSTLGVAYASATLRAALAGESAAAPSVRAWYNRSLRSVDLVLLGSIVYNLMWCFGYPAQSLLVDRERGSLEVLAATPAGTLEIWLATVTPYLVVALWGCLVQIALLAYVVHVPFRGDPLLLLGGMALIGYIHVAFGPIAAVLARTVNHLAVQANIFAFVSMALSGFLIPSSYLPDWTRALGQAVPMTHALTFVRAVYQKGAGAAAVAPELIALAGFAVAVTVPSILCLRALRLGDRR